MTQAFFMYRILKKNIYAYSKTKSEQESSMNICILQRGLWCYFHNRSGRCAFYRPSSTDLSAVPDVTMVASESVTLKWQPSTLVGSIVGGAAPPNDAPNEAESARARPTRIPTVRPCSRVVFRVSHTRIPTVRPCSIGL